MTRSKEIPDVYLVDEPTWISDLSSVTRGGRSDDENLYDALQAIQSRISRSADTIHRVNLRAANRLIQGDKEFRREVIAHVHRGKKFGKK